MDENMPASGSLPETHPLYAPGLTRRRRLHSEARYWLPTRKDIEKGFRPKTMSFDDDLSEAEVAARCRELWASLTAWRQGKEGPTRHSIAWLVDRYLRDEASPYRTVGHRAQRNYTAFSKLIASTVGKRIIGKRDDGYCTISGEDVMRWHRAWGQPDEDGEPTTPGRQRHAIVQLRMLARYAVTLSVPGSIEFDAMLKRLRFPQLDARTVAPTWDQIQAIVSKALDMGYRSIAITTLAQFELTERRTHIIGSYIGTGAKQTWRPGWQWEAIDDNWVITYFQTKVGRVKRRYDLKEIPRLLALVQAIPENQRSGPVIKCETTGTAWHDRYYAEVWRKIARAAGVPDEIRSMDCRAGAATEAADLGATEAELQAAGGWKDPKMAARYTRAPETRAENVVKMRQKARGGA